MKPTEICLLSLWSLPNCRSRLISAPFPKGFFREAWKATVGNSSLRMEIHFLVAHVGTRSILFRTNMRCFVLFSFFM